LHVRLGAYDAALASYTTAASHLNGLDSAEIEFKQGLVYQRRGEWDAAERQFAQAHALWQAVADAVALARLCVAWSQVALRRNDVPRASALADEAAQWAQQAGSIPVEARSANLQGMLARRERDFVSAENHLRHCLALADAQHDLDMQVAALNNLALVERDRGAIDGAIQHVQKALELCQTYGDRHHEAALRNNLADLYHLAGLTEAAREEVRLSVQIYSDIGGDGPPSQPEIWMLAEW
jgi:tetratricopeptide (TPR) repeat protein